MRHKKALPNPIYGAVFFVLFCMSGLFLLLTYANNNLCLGIYRLFREDGVLYASIKGSILRFAIAAICMAVMLWLDHVFSDELYCYIAIGRERKIRIGILIIYRLFEITLILLLLYRISYSAYENYKYQQKVFALREMLTEERLVIHAGGEIDGYTYTNSKEALENCYALGNRVSEIDFIETADGTFVLGHDGEDGNWVNGINSSRELTLNEYLQQRLFGRFTTMGLEELGEFMRQNEDFYVVTDVKDENIKCCGIIAEMFPDLRERFIIQIYHENEYDAVRALGFPYIIYTLYRTDEEESEADALRRFSDRHDLVGYTFWDYLAEGDFLADMIETDTPLFVHTVNDEAEMQEFIKNGISGIYTDRVDMSADNLVLYSHE